MKKTFFNLLTSLRIFSIFLSLLFLLSGSFLSGVQAQTPDSEAERNLFPKNAVILFQGDSVTDGNRGRSADPNHIHGHGYVYLIASYLGAAYPEQNWTFVNRGVSGNTLKELHERWEKDALAIQPDVLSIMIGVNDFGRKVSPEEYEKNYDSLLKRTRERLPNVRLVLMEPLWRSPGSDVQDAYRQIVRRMAERYDAVFVPLQEDFNSVFDSAPDPKYWVWDSVHPTTAGHWRIFRAWLESVKKSNSEKR